MVHGRMSIIKVILFVYAALLFASEIGIVGWLHDIQMLSTKAGMLIVINLVRTSK